MDTSMPVDGVAGWAPAQGFGRDEDDGTAQARVE